MKTIFKTLLIGGLMASIANQTNAQGLKMPQPSTTQTIVQDFGLGKISVNYSRPNVKGRKIFGGLAPYDMVWRTGANAATIIKFTDDITIEGQNLPAGEYGLFTIPGKTEWTVIFNKGAKQWGSYEYKQNDDVLRIKVKPTTTKEKTETFTINFTNVVDTTATLYLGWENTAINLKLATSIDAKVMASIAEAMKGDKKPYFSAAMYYYNTGRDLKQALTWMEEADKGNQNAPWIKLWKGRALLKAGNKADAAKSAKEGLEIAKKINNEEYIRLNTALLNEAK